MTGDVRANVKERTSETKMRDNSSYGKKVLSHTHVEKKRGPKQTLMTDGDSRRCIF